MSQCYLCESESLKGGCDFGRRDVFSCEDCGTYEVGPSAAAKLTKMEFPKARRAQIGKTVVAINKMGKVAEIVLDGETLSVRPKPNSEIRQGAHLEDTGQGVDVSQLVHNGLL